MNLAKTLEGSELTFEKGHGYHLDGKKVYPNTGRKTINADSYEVESGKAKIGAHATFNVDDVTVEEDATVKVKDYKPSKKEQQSNTADSTTLSKDDKK